MKKKDIPFTPENLDNTTENNTPKPKRGRPKKNEIVDALNQLEKSVTNLETKNTNSVFEEQKLINKIDSVAIESLDSTLINTDKFVQQLKKVDETSNVDSKIYVLDTSIILSDAKNIIILSQDNNNTIIIPETVLDEIDNKKSGFNETSYNAREFGRMVSNSKVISVTKKEDLGISESLIELDTPEKNRVILVNKFEYKVSFANEYQNIVNDRKILEVALVYSSDNTVLLSNDIALRSRAISVGLHTQPILKDKVDKIDTYDLIEYIDIDFKDIDIIEEVSCEFFSKNFSNFTNVVFNVSNNQKILTFYKNGKFHKLDEKLIRSHPIKPKNIEQQFFMNMLLDPEVKIIVCHGVTGSGKNILALQGGLHFMSYEHNQGLNSGIKYCRNTITSGDAEAQLGFLKGDENAKLSVFSYPLIDSINKFIEVTQRNAKKNNKSMKLTDHKEFMVENSISVLNPNQMRGSNVYGYVILDEAQNFSKNSLKLMLTRINDGSKVIIFGDINQIDNSYLNKFDNGLSIMLKHAKNHDFVAGIKLNKVLRGKIADFSEKNL